MKVFISSIQLLVDRFRDELNASNVEASNRFTSQPEGSPEMERIYFQKKIFYE